MIGEWKVNARFFPAEPPLSNLMGQFWASVDLTEPEIVGNYRGPLSGAPRRLPARQRPFVHEPRLTDPAIGLCRLSAQPRAAEWSARRFCRRREELRWCDRIRESSVLPARIHARL